MLRTDLQFQSETTSRSQVQLEPSIARHFKLFANIVFGLLRSVNAVFHQRTEIGFAFVQEGEVNGQIPFVPIGHTAYKPVDVFLAYGYDVFAYLTCQYES